MVDVLASCSNREDLGWIKTDSGEPIYLCTKVNDKLGWRNAVDSKCCHMCGKDKDVYTQGIVRAAIKFGLRDYKESSELYRSIYKGNRRHLVRKALQEGISHNDILVNLAKGITMGVPQEEVISIAEEFKLFNEEH